MSIVSGFGRFVSACFGLVGQDNTGQAVARFLDEEEVETPEEIEARRSAMNWRYRIAKLEPCMTYMGDRHITQLDKVIYFGSFSSKVNTKKLVDQKLITDLMRITLQEPMEVMLLEYLSRHKIPPYWNCEFVSFSESDQMFYAENITERVRQVQARAEEHLAVLNRQQADKPNITQAKMSVMYLKEARQNLEERHQIMPYRRVVSIQSLLEHLTVKK